MQSAARLRQPDDAVLARRAAEICLDHKADNVVLLDLHGVTDMTDYFIVASGTSDTHVRGVAQHVMDSLQRQGVRAASVEGLTLGRWVLLDYVDFVVHVFHPTQRARVKFVPRQYGAPNLLTFFAVQSRNNPNPSSNVHKAILLTVNEMVDNCK